MTAIVDKDWVELDTETKAAAEILGYSEAIWDGNGKVPLEDIKFDSLTKEQQAAVEKIGLEDDDWDEEDKGLRYENIDWEKLLPEVKAAATTLKYTQELWDHDKDSPLDEKDWCELSADEKAAASVLGYDEEKWDG